MSGRLLGGWGGAGKWCQAIKTNAQLHMSAWVPAALLEMTDPEMNLPKYPPRSFRGRALSILVLSDVSQ